MSSTNEPSFHKAKDEEDWLRMFKIMKDCADELHLELVTVKCPFCGKATPVYSNTLYRSATATGCLWCEGLIQLKRNRTYVFYFATGGLLGSSKYKAVKPIFRFAKVNEK